MILNRNQAINLMLEYTKNPALHKHMYAVEVVMRAYARKFNEDEEEWGIVGILHDFDYEMFPNAPEHPLKGAEILKTKGYSENIINAILGHAPYTNITRDTLMAKTLYAVDELCGFITACALVRPNRLSDLEAASVKKKLKDNAFAKNVNRDDIVKGAEELGVDLNQHIQFCIDAMKSISTKLGL